MDTTTNVDGMSDAGSASTYGTTVAAARIAMGLLGLAAPATTQRLSLLGGETTAIVHLWTRFWATRAIGLGASYLTADLPTRRHLIRAGLLVDGLDTAFLVAMAARRRLPTSAVAWLATITATAAAADVVEILREPSDAGSSRPRRHPRRRRCRRG